MIPISDTIQIVDFELDGVRAWGGRHQVGIDWLSDALELRATFIQRSTSERFYLQALLNDYKELPPAMTFCNESWEATNAKSNFPKPPSQSPFGSSIFIDHNGKPVICAPFNRLAYRTYAGPHGDWGNPAQWQTAAAGQAHATTIADMLQIILRDLNLTTGRMGQ